MSENCTFSCQVPDSNPTCYLSTKFDFVHFFRMVLEMRNAHQSKHQNPYFAHRAEFMTVCKRCKLKMVNFLEIVPHFANPAQPYRPFLVGLEHIADAKGILGRLAHLGNSFVCFYSWRFWYIKSLRYRCKPTSTLAFLSVLQLDPGSDALHPLSAPLQSRMSIGQLQLAL